MEADYDKHRYSSVWCLISKLVKRNNIISRLFQTSKGEFAYPLVVKLLPLCCFEHIFHTAAGHCCIPFLVKFAVWKDKSKLRRKLSSFYAMLVSMGNVLSFHYGYTAYVQAAKRGISCGDVDNRGGAPLIGNYTRLSRGHPVRNVQGKPGSTWDCLMEAGNNCLLF